jgi:HAD superfamily hydrolase (TIGR01509 family)
LVSNTNALHVRYCVAALPILQKLDALVMSNEVGFAKPDPAIFEHALGLAGVAPHEAAFFDDIQAYVDAASALGIAGRLFTTAPAFERDLTSFGL